MTTPTELLRLGQFATQLKELAARSVGQNYYQLRLRIEEMIRQRGYQVLFPLNVNPGRTLSHQVPLPSCVESLGDQDHTTIDLGIRHQDHLIDTAVTIVKEESQPVLDSYRRAMDRAIEAIRAKYRSQGALRVKQITRIVQECYSQWTIVQECCAHQIRGGELYATVIMMCARRYRNQDGDRLIGPGSLITLEPHVVLGSHYHMTPGPGRIARVDRGYQAREQGGEIHTIMVNHPGFYQEHMLYFQDCDGVRQLRVIT